jgi:hypothetical protein
MTNGVPTECMGLSLDVQADIEKGEPGDVAESASALVRCVTAAGGSMAHSRGMTVVHKKHGGHMGYGMHKQRMPKLEYGYKPSSAYGYGGGMHEGYGYGSHRSYGYGKRGYGYGKRGYGYGRRYS